MRSTSKKWQNNSKNPTTQRLTSSGTSILTPSRDSRPSITTLPETTDKGSTNDIHFGDQPTSMIIGEMTRATTMAEMELLAQNRGNAMLRYKEKRKTRRHVLSSYLLYYNFWICMSIIFWTEVVHGLSTGTISISAMSLERPGQIQGSEWRVVLWRQMKLQMSKSAAECMWWCTL